MFSATALDAWDALFPNQDTIYTFGQTPDWANASAGTQYPPDDLQDLYDFATWIADHRKTRAGTRYYEIWNEASSYLTYWHDTAANMATAASGVASAIKAADPAAVILMPSVNFTNGLGFAEALFAAGIGPSVDVLNYHPYPTWQSPTAPPEQTWNLVTQFKALFDYYGQQAKPVFATEGSWLNATLAGTVDLRVAYTAVYLALLYSGGVTRQIWFEYDTEDANNPGLLWDGASGLNTEGIAYQETMSWLRGATFTSPIAREASTNQIANPTGTGMVAGTPGTPPTGWAVLAPDVAKGVTTEFVGSGLEDGIAYVDWHVYGTPTSGSGGSTYLRFDSAAAALNGESWTSGAHVKVQAGSLTGINGAQYQPGVKLFFDALNSGGSLLSTIMEFAFHPIGAGLPNDLQCYAGTMTNALTAKIRPGIKITGYTVGTPFDVTLRIGLPFADKGSVWSGVFTKPGGYKAKFIWDAAGDSSFTPTSEYTQYRDLTGAVTAVAVPGSTAITIGKKPLLFETGDPP